jgi:hypothetical protein
MQTIAPQMAVFLAALLAGCASVFGSAVESGQGDDATIVIRGRYTESSNALQALEQAMALEAGKRCPSGWTKVSDENNPRSLTGGRVWRVRCNPGDASASAPTAAPQVAALAPTAGTATEARAEMTAAAATAAAPSSAPSRGQAMSREDLVRMLAAAVKRAGPYLTDSAAEDIVAEQLRTLAAARLGVLGPDGQPLPLLPAR